MSNIPQARKMLFEFAERLPKAEQMQLQAIVNEFLFREPPVRRAPEKSTPITPHVRGQIYALGATDMPMSEIGARLNINPGRVSEVLNGKR